jgi:hypothetical protein
VALRADEAKVAQLVTVEGRFGRSSLLVAVIDLAQVAFDAPRDVCSAAGLRGTRE